MLIVEDDERLQTSLGAALTVLGFNPHRADSIDAALKVLGTEHVDAIVLDIRLPDMTGLQRSGLTLLAFLRATAEYAHIPVLIFTGAPLSADEETLIRRYDAHLFHKQQPYGVLAQYLTHMLSHPPAH